MKLNDFLSTFKLTSQNKEYSRKLDEVGYFALQNVPDLKELLSDLGGAVFEKGLLKIHTTGSSHLWTNLTFEFFKKYKVNSYCFAFDWTGRQYAINSFDGKRFILMLDSGTAEAYKLEADIESFLNEELEEFKEGVLENRKFSPLAEKFGDLPFNKCYGFKKPLFLGGKDEVENLEIVDLEVYWELNRQIYEKTKNLPPDTKVDFSI